MSERATPVSREKLSAYQQRVRSATLVWNLGSPLVAAGQLHPAIQGDVDIPHLVQRLNFLRNRIESDRTWHGEPLAALVKDVHDAILLEARVCGITNPERLHLNVTAGWGGSDDQVAVALRLTVLDRTVSIDLVQCTVEVGGGD